VTESEHHDPEPHKNVKLKVAVTWFADYSFFYKVASLLSNKNTVHSFSEYTAYQFYAF
jgi:hypothetical protein